MKPRGRPKTSPLSRAEQLRRAKRAQRKRDRAAGMMQVQLKLPAPLAARLAVVMKRPDFNEQLAEWLNLNVVSLKDYPALADIAWNRTDEVIPAREAFALYERNWRFVDQAQLDPQERALIQRLADRFGAGLSNA